MAELRAESADDSDVVDADSERVTHTPAPTADWAEVVLGKLIYQVYFNVFTANRLCFLSMGIRTAVSELNRAIFLGLNATGE